MKELDELTCIDERFNNIRLRYIQEILDNKSIRDKRELIKVIQSTPDIFEVKKIMEDKGISISEKSAIQVKKGTIQEYNKEYTSNGMKWDNRKIIKYCNKSRKELQGDRTPSTFKILQQKVKNFWGVEIK